MTMSPWMEMQVDSKACIDIKKIQMPTFELVGI